MAIKLQTREKIITSVNVIEETEPNLQLLICQLVNDHCVADQLFNLETIHTIVFFFKMRTLEFTKIIKLVKNYQEIIKLLKFLEVT